MSGGPQFRRIDWQGLESAPVSPWRRLLNAGNVVGLVFELAAIAVVVRGAMILARMTPVMCGHDEIHPGDLCRYGATTIETFGQVAERQAIVGGMMVGTALVVAVIVAAIWVMIRRSNR